MVFIRFTLEPPDSRCGQLNRATDQAAAAQEAGPRGAGATAVVPIPPQFLYATKPRTYTHKWVAETAGMGVAELDKECGLYRDSFTGNPVEYVTIITTLFTTSEIMFFLTVLDRDQVCSVHLKWIFSCVIGKHTPLHHIILYWGGELGELLPLIVMVSSEGLVPWFHLEKMYLPLALDLAILDMIQEISVTEPVVTGYADNSPNVSVQLIVMIPDSVLDSYEEQEF